MKKVKFLSVIAALGLAAPSLGGEPAIRHNMPPAARLAEPGPMVGGPGPGVLAPETIPVPGYGAGVPVPTTQILFNQPQSMKISYDVVGDGSFTSDCLIVPGRLEFAQGGIYRLKLTDVAGREGVELYPTVEVGHSNPRTAAYLAHNAISIQFTEEDLDQALSGNFVTKVILAIVRLGNKDIELTAAAYANGGVPGLMGPGGMGPGGMGPGGMCGPDGRPIDPMSAPPNMVAGVTAPQYGMTYSGTPIGLPGPPHIPFGHKAGLQQHVMKNKTHMHIPDPVDKMKMTVRQQPGYSYPTPPSHIRIREQNINPGYPAGRPGFYHASRPVPSNLYGGAQGPGPGGAGGPGAGEYCPPGTPQIR